MQPLRGTQWLHERLDHLALVTTSDTFSLGIVGASPFHIIFFFFFGLSLKSCAVTPFFFFLKKKREKEIF